MISAKEGRWQDPAGLWSEWCPVVSEQKDSVLGTLLYTFQTTSGSTVQHPENKAELRNAGV